MSPPSTRPLRIGIVAGEASGDVLAAGMIRQIKAQYPDAIIEGIAGPHMQAAGCTSLYDMEALSVMGLVEVLSRLRQLLGIRKGIYQHFIDNPPDVFVGVDAPDFNLTLERKLKEAGIKTVHYVSPTVWAWREKRIHKIARATDLVLSIFPFEKAFYDQHKVPCRFVGHTLADSIPVEVDQGAAREQLGIEPQDKVLALLPGSRGREVDTLLPVFLDTAARIVTHTGQLTVLIPAANEARKQQISDLVAAHSSACSVRILDGQAREAMIAADGVLLASGTATLEAMLCKRPMVAAYKLNWLTHKMMQRMYKARFFTLPNLLADRPIIPELLQQDVNPQTLCDHMLPLLLGQQHQDIDTFIAIHRQLRQHADKQAADAVLELCHD
ncbi:lipid-A-disaccharide synthase [Aestuariibacter halophilus]|uniref:Lipid-A-disaccharide synthase n=1 Tax=Fluctibacter halophilus TaxID=226011 RepID=A0ABS8GCC4_9ALTE|nr:lipid-A-disaccharide synthase [Aestuariibacter halophilus]MCC2618177.1 lipid-A-disaccharide synthase [Aestuariibacter halophilus]